MAQQYNFFAMVNRMKMIDRWALMQNTSKEEIVSLIRNNPNKNISTNLKTILPDGFVKELLNILNLSDVKGNSLTKEDENTIIENIKNNQPSKMRK